MRKNLMLVFTLSFLLIFPNYAFSSSTEAAAARLRILVHLGGFLTLVGAVGYQTGKLIVGIDKNYYDGKLVQSVSEKGEPIFEPIYKVQKKIESHLSQE